MDRISALSDDLLHLVLGRLGCVRTAARTSLLSRRWRGLWSRLRMLVFRGVAFHRLEPALARVSHPAVSLLDICVPRHGNLVLTWLSRQQHAASAASVGSLLRAATRLSPDEFVLTAPTLLPGCGWEVDLPSFHRAASIKLDVVHLLLQLPAETQFPALETLCLSGCFVQVATLVPRCPRLRVLKVKLPPHAGHYDMTVHSPTLEELVVESQTTTEIDIVAPELKHLALCFYHQGISELSVAISAPRLERVSWDCKFIGPTWSWTLAPAVTTLEPTSWGELPPAHRCRLCTCQRVLLLPLSKLLIRNRMTPCHNALQGLYKLPYEGRYEGVFSQEMEKLLFADFSALELHLTTMGHVFGAFVMNLLGMNPIRCAIQKLKIVLPRSKGLKE
ncbi:hypothetical protein QYE76_026198 [Lolium multiflorum]|uniref:F-box/LRR-repeat protein 15/At3g58940/PEG3-like LRR domain-containing protein n=1 Tax=Lolium multiflorum TaxID=4521 RepID=A0AAD8RH85_LOLMU|nr:hypothetical protein QYE76_026198 [Lolium multiflorum]